MEYHQMKFVNHQIDGLRIDIPYDAVFVQDSCNEAQVRGRCYEIALDVRPPSSLILSISGIINSMANSETNVERRVIVRKGAAMPPLGGTESLFEITYASRKIVRGWWMVLGNGPDTVILQCVLKRDFEKAESIVAGIARSIRFVS